MAAKGTLITIHHFPGSGGTIFSKAIAAMDGVIVLSEIHPDRHLGGRFHPLVQMQSGYGELLDDADRTDFDAHFLAEIGLAYDVARKNGRKLAIRDHIHRDFLSSDRGHSRLVEVLAPEYRLNKVVSLRDPVDCFLSYDRTVGASKGLLPDLSVDRFCERFLDFVDSLPEAAVVRYEDFVDAPALILQGLSARLGLRFNPAFADRIAEFKHFTGDSGRKGGEIEPRPRRPHSDSLITEFEASPNYATICARFDYAPISSNPESQTPVAT